LTGTINTEAPIDLPDYSPSGPLYTHANPRQNLQWFNTSGFTPETLGTIGNAPRRFFYGPGLNNWDLAVLKDTKITESKSLQLRFEMFNAWNHTQFQGPSGNISSGTFGFITSANSARVLQVGAKILF
jgi:hypothetical protein